MSRTKFNPRESWSTQVVP